MIRLLVFLSLALSCHAQTTLLLSRDASVVTYPRWDDSMVPAMSFKTGATAPTLGNFGPSGTLQIYLFQADSANDQVYGSVQMPHSWIEGDDLSPHVHWARTAAPGSASLTNVVWGLEYSFTTLGGVFGAPSTITVTNAVDGTNWNHQLSGFEHFHTTGAKVSSIMVFRLYRKATDDADTYDQNVALLGFDIHLRKDGIGSANELTK